VIPRLKPHLGKKEFFALFQYKPDAVTQFEAEFARTFEAQQAIAFPYGRSALWAFFKALNIENAEIIMPAYTCVVVAHAIVFSGNIPCFVDITLDNYNMDLNQVELAINEHTRAVVATHLFGYPLDVDRLNEIVQLAEKRYGHKIWVIQDCAHSFGSRWQGQLTCKAGDIALFGLNTAKYLTALGGGMLTTDNSELATRIRQCCAQTFLNRQAWRNWERRVYFLATKMAFSRPGYSFTHWLEHNTHVLDRFVRYYDEHKIDLPQDFQRNLTTVEASVGQVQLTRLKDFEERRRAIAQQYYIALHGLRHLSIPPWQEGATYSHFVALLAPELDRTWYIGSMARAGIEIGYKLEYCIPYMGAYTSLCNYSPFSKGLNASRQIINLPISPTLNDEDVRRVIAAIQHQEANFSQQITPIIGVSH